MLLLLGLGQVNILIVILLSKEYINCHCTCVLISKANIFHANKIKLHKTNPFYFSDLGNKLK